MTRRAKWVMLCAAVAPITSQQLAQGSATWTFNADGSWSVSTNWNGPVPVSAGERAVLGPFITGPHLVAVDAPLTIGGLVFSSNSAYAVAGPGTLTLSSLGGASISAAG